MFYSSIYRCSCWWRRTYHCTCYLASESPHIALGTNKVSSSIGTVSALNFATSGKVNWELYAIFFSWSFIGSETVVLIDSKYLYPITIVLLLLVLIYTLVNKKMGEENNFQGLNKGNVNAGRVMGFIMGFYDGFFRLGNRFFFNFCSYKF